MTSISPRNGTKTLLYWIMGAMLTFLVFVIGILTANMRAEVGKNSDYRVKAEGVNARQDATLDSFKESLTRIEKKLDEVVRLVK